MDLPFGHWNNVHTDKAVAAYEGESGSWKRAFAATTGRIYETPLKKQRISTEEAGKTKVGAWSNSNTNPTLLMIIVNKKMNLMVKWAWFEDQLLNRYTSFVGGSDGDLKMTIRSIDTLLSVDPETQGQPISTEGKTAEELKDAFPEQSIPPLQKFNKVLKTPTQIRYNQLMLANNPLKSFILENLPSSDRIAAKGTFEIGNLFQRLKDGGSQASFKDPNDERKGFLRNIWVNITEIQEAFGISNVESLRGGSTKNRSQIKPVSSVIKALENLLKKLNNNFNNPWKFEVVSDPYDSTNLKIIDNNVSGVKSPVYTKFNHNSHRVKDKIGIYKFPSFKIGSIVKNQTLEFKIPNAQSVTALFANNTTRGGQKYSGGLVNNQMSRLFEQDTSSVYDDKYLKNLNKSHIYIKTALSGSEELPVILMTPVGSEKTHHNAPIIQNQTKDSFNVVATEPWYTRWDPNSSEKFSKISSLKEKKVKNFYRINNDEIVEMTTHRFYEGWSILGIESEIGKELKEGTPLVPGVDYAQTENHVSYYDYSSSTKSLELKSPLRSLVRAQLGAKNPHLPVDVVVPCELGLEVDGIGGIVPGDIIQTDYIQSKYNAPLKEKGENGEEFGPLVYFEVWSLSQKISATGWTTDIQSKMRFNSVATEKELQFVKLDSPVKQLEKTEHVMKPGTAQIPSGSVSPFGGPNALEPGFCSLGPDIPDKEACEAAGGEWIVNTDMSYSGTSGQNSADFLEVGATFPETQLPKWSPKDLTPDDVMKVARNPEIDRAFEDSNNTFIMPDPFLNEPIFPVNPVVPLEPPVSVEKFSGCRPIPENGIHIVVLGDTLSDIAKDYCVDLSKIKKYNPQLDEKFTIREGDKIYLDGRDVMVSTEVIVEKSGKKVPIEKRIPMNNIYQSQTLKGNTNFYNPLNLSVVDEGYRNIREIGTEAEYQDTGTDRFQNFSTDATKYWSTMDSNWDESVQSLDSTRALFGKSAKEEKVLKEND